MCLFFPIVIQEIIYLPLVSENLFFFGLYPIVRAGAEMDLDPDPVLEELGVTTIRSETSSLRSDTGFSVEEVKRMTNACVTCNECKPRFYKPVTTPLIKATQPFERLNLDFKGPLPSTSPHRYLLDIVDEYSRFPFAFPSKDVSTPSVIKCLTQLFSIFGLYSP